MAEIIKNSKSIHSQQLTYHFSRILIPLHFFIHHETPTVQKDWRGRVDHRSSQQRRHGSQPQFPRRGRHVLQDCRPVELYAAQTRQESPSVQFHPGK